MKPYRLIFALFFLFSLLSPAAAKDKWINVRTKNLNLVSNASEGDTRNLALKLEQFLFVVSKITGSKTVTDVPVTVMVFKNDGAFKPFKPLYDGKPANVAGYFQRNDDENIIAFNISANQHEYPLSTIFHEYLHLLTSYTQRQWPPWLMEGVAEFYSSFIISKNKATLGAPVSSHVYTLRNNKFIPFQTLFSVDRYSDVYNERTKQGIFYAQSWALVHYLMLGNQGARMKQFNEFIRAYEQGKNAEQAFTEIFQTDFATMEKELRRYVGNDTYTAVNYELDSTDAGATAEIRPLTDVEAQFYLGNLLMRTGRLDEAEPFFRQALALDPAYARSYEGMGFLALRRSRHEEAMEHFKQAVSRDSKNHLAHYYYAESLRYEATKDGSPLSPENAKKIIDSLKASVNLMSGFAPAYYMLGVMHLTTGEDLAAGARMIRTAIKLAPQNKHYTFTLAQIQMQMEDYAGAKKTLEQIISSDADAHWKTQAKSMLEVIENYTRPVAKTDEPDRSQVAESHSRAIEKDMKFEGMEKMSGVLLAIECERGMVLVLRTEEKLARFAVSDPAKLQFFTMDSDLKLEIACGTINLRATVYFKAATGRNARMSGDAVAVELKK